MHRMSYSSKKGQCFAGEGRTTMKEAKVTGATTCYGRGPSPVSLISEEDDFKQFHEVLFLYRFFLSNQCNSRLIYTWVTLVQGSVMCSPGWKCFSTDIKSLIWSRGDFKISGVIFFLHWVWPPLFTKQHDLCQLLLSRKQTGKEGFGFLGLPTNWIWLSWVTYKLVLKASMRVTTNPALPAASV